MNRKPSKIILIPFAFISLLIYEYHVQETEDAALWSFPSAQATTAATGPAVGAQIAPVSDDRQWIDDILARPPFRASRRPPLQRAYGVLGSAALPRLTGVLVSGAVKIAIFAAGEDGKAVVVREGDRIGTYLVQSIDNGQASVLGPSGVAVLRPEFNRVQASLRVDPPGRRSDLPSFLDLMRNGRP